MTGRRYTVEVTGSLPDGERFCLYRGGTLIAEATWDPDTSCYTRDGTVLAFHDWAGALAWGTALTPAQVMALDITAVPEDGS